MVMKKILLTLFFLVFVLGICGAASATGLADSPQPKFHHDNKNTGKSEYKGPQTNNVKWKFDTGSSIGTEPVIGSDGTIYIGTYDSKLYALNPNGTVKWNYTGTGMALSTPAIGDDGRIYAGFNYLYTLDKYGDLKWKYTDYGIASSLAIGNDNNIYFGGAAGDGGLYVLNHDGLLKWYYVESYLGRVITTPAIGSDDTIYFGADLGAHDGCLYAVEKPPSEDIKLGLLKWKYKITGSTIVSSPAIGSDGTIYFGCLDNYLYALNSVDGTLKWRYQTGGEITSSPAIGNGAIYFGSDDGYIYALNLTGNLIWRGYTGDVVESSPTIGSDGTIYLGCSNDEIYALNPDGSLKWYYDTGVNISSSPAIGSNGTLYVAAHGYLYAFNDDTTPPTAYASPKGGTYTNTQSVVLKMNESGNIYYTINGSTPTTSSTRYTKSLVISNSKTLKFFALDLAGNKSSIYTQIYRVSDKTNPTVKSSLPSGYYNSSKSVTLKISEPGNIYYTINGSTPTTSSTKYTSSLKITKTTTLKYFARDSVGRKSSIYTMKYVIDKTAPQISSTTLVNGTTKTATIKVNFNEKIKTSTYWSNIKVKNLTTGTYSTITKSISSNNLYIKTTSTRSAKTWYQVIIPAKAVKDYAGNNLNTVYTYKFKTSA